MPGGCAGEVIGWSCGGRTVFVSSFRWPVNDLLVSHVSSSAPLAQRRVQEIIEMKVRHHVEEVNSWRGGTDKRLHTTSLPAKIMGVRKEE